MKILYVTADPMPREEAPAKRVAETFLDTLRATEPNVEIDTCDLYEDRPPYLDYDMCRFLWYPLPDGDYVPTPREQTARCYLSDHAARFNAADILVLAAPVWHYSVPAILKAWIDVIVAPNYTFHFVDGQRQPMHRIERLFAFLSAGGLMGRGNARDSLVGQLRSTFEFIAISEQAVVLIDGQDPTKFPDCRQREQRAVEQARRLAREVAGQASRSASAGRRPPRPAGTRRSRPGRSR